MGINASKTVMQGKLSCTCADLFDRLVKEIKISTLNHADKSDECHKGRVKSAVRPCPF